MKKAKNPRRVITKKPAHAASKNGGSGPRRRAGTEPRRVRTILAKLDEAYPSATCALEHQDPFQLLIATILFTRASVHCAERIVAISNWIGFWCSRAQVAEG